MSLLNALIAILTLLALPQANARLKELADFPSNRSFMWSEEAQGVAHDDHHWFFSQAHALWKVPAANDLNRHFGGSNKEFGIIKRVIPERLRQLGYTHFGDIDHHAGFVYVPLEGAKPYKLLIYRARDLALVGEANFPDWQEHAPWVAVHPRTGEIWTSEFSPAKEVGIYRYKLIRQEGAFKLQVAGTFLLRTKDGDRLTDIRRIQGAAFDLINGQIIFASDSNDGGLISFDMEKGTLRWQQYVNFRPGFPHYEEMEGLDVWHTPGGTQVQGGIHLILLDNDVGPDDIYFKHYRQ